MVELWLPYGKTEVVVRVPHENLMGVVDAEEKEGVQDPKAEVVRALEKPIGSRKLDEIVGAGGKVAVVVDDGTRPAPSHLMVPPLLEKLNQAGVRDEDVTIIIGCGTHRPTRPEEASSLIGGDIANRVKIVSHDCNARDLVYVGDTSFKTKVYVNRIFAESDVRILTGDIGLHYFAGYRGGRKSVLPAVAGEATTRHNHALLIDPRAKTGNLEGNPVHADMEEAARLAKVDFILNTVANTKGEIVRAFAGDLDQAFTEGVKLVDEMFKVPVDRPADIVVVSPGGHPADIDLYQSCKAIDSVLNVVRDGGVVILLAECPEGHGHKVFSDWMVRFKSLDEVERAIKRSFAIGGHKAYFLMRALKKANIIIVSVMPGYYSTGVFRLRTAKTVNSALRSALRMTGRKGKVLVAPHGATILPFLQE